MKNQINSVLYKLLFASLLLIVTGISGVFAANGRERFLEKIRLEANVKVKNPGNLRCGNNADFINAGNFQIGKEFALALFDAERMETNENSLNFTIVDLVYLIERLENQPEAAKLQALLKAVIRATKNAAQTRKEIETISKEYLNRQKNEQKWHFNAGHKSMNLMFSSYAGDDAKIKKDLADLQALIKIAPAATDKNLIAQINSLLQYEGKTTFSEEDYTAIFEGISALVETVSA